MQEIRWHGRGGQGAWTASELLAKAAILEGKHIQSFPEFGPERMGAPVRAFTRISEHRIMLHCTVYSPNIVVVLDPTLLRTIDVTDGLEEDGTLVINSKDPPSETRKKLKSDVGKLWTVPATEIAIKFLGRPITNTAMLGAVTKISKIVKLKSVEEVIKDRFEGPLSERNIAVVRSAYEEAKQE